MAIMWRSGHQGPAINVLCAFARRAESAARDGALSESERRLLVGNADYLIGRLGQ